MNVTRIDPIDAFVGQCCEELGVPPVGQMGRSLLCGNNLYDTGKEDRRARYPHAMGVDMFDGNGVDITIDLEDRLTPTILGSFEHIECHSVLEHAKRPWLIADNIKSMLVPRGTLSVLVPFAWRIHDYPSDYWRFTAAALVELFRGFREVRTAYCYSDGTIDRKGKVPSITDTYVDAGPELKFIARAEAMLFGVR